MRDVQDALEYHYYDHYRRFSPRHGIRSAQRERKRDIPRGTDNLREFSFDSCFQPV